MKKKKEVLNKKELSRYKKDTVGLFSGHFKTSFFKGKKDKLNQLEVKLKQNKYQD